MRFLYTVAAGALAAIASAKDVTFDGPFFLTFVEKNGTEIPATIGEASRGIKILSAWNKYEQQFSYDGETKRLTAADHPEWGPNVGLGAEAPVLFTTEEEGDDKLDQIEVDGETYIVKAGVGAEGAAGWNALPPVGGEHGDVYFNNVYWTGAGDPQANSRLRIDTKQPTRRH